MVPTKYCYLSRQSQNIREKEENNNKYKYAVVV